MNLVLTILAVLSLIIGTVKLFRTRTAKRIYTSHADGVVVFCNSIRSGDDCLYSYLIVYTVDGHEYQINRTDSFNPGKAGQKLPVRYDPGSPSDCICQGESSSLPAIILIVIGALLLPGPLYQIMHR